MTEINDIELLKELGEELEPEKTRQYTPLEARLIAGFEDILNFVAEHERAPQHGDDRDIFERIYAVRLDQLRKNSDAIKLLTDMDSPGLLHSTLEEPEQDIDDETILTDIGEESVSSGEPNITQLRNVSPMKHRRAAEEIANREVCLLYTSPSPRDQRGSRMPSSA